MKKNDQSSKVMSLGDIINGTDARAPRADISNAGYLFGDPTYGAPVIGSPVIGDPQNIAPLATWNTLIGDAEETGSIWDSRFARTAGKVLPYVAAAAAGYGAGRWRGNVVADRRVADAYAANVAQSTIQNQINARQVLGKLDRTAAVPFYMIAGATLNSYPLAPTEAFAADTMKYNFDRQATDTPFESEIVNASFAAGTWTATTTGVASNRFYVATVLTIGINALNANPGTVFNVTGTFPLINGTLSVSAQPFSFTLQNGYYAQFILFPWTLVTNKPLLSLGQYSAATPITVAVTGLPSAASVTLIVPGSQHVWTIGMRNRLV
jgi:hypothetical protein